MNLRQLALALGGLVALAACSSNPAYDEAHFWHAASPSAACNASQAEMMKGVNFAQSKVVDVTIKDGVYTPATLNLMHGQPYLLRFHNDDADAHAVP